MMKDPLTVSEAYAAMYIYLDELYRKHGFDQLGGILEEMSLLEDGTPADPAVWHDWLQSVTRVKAGDYDIRFKLGK